MSHNWTNVTHLQTGAYRAERDGIAYFIPDDMSNADRRDLQEWIDAGGTVTNEPEPPVLIQPVARWRFHAVLKLQGLDATLEAVFAALPEPDQTVARSRFAYSDTYDRYDPLVVQLGTAMGLSEQQLDDLWIAGHAL